MSSMLNHRAPERTNSNASIEPIQAMMNSMIASNMISMQQQMQNQNHLQPPMTPMQSTQQVPMHSSTPQKQPLSGRSVKFQSSKDKNESSSDDE